jgi:hypothetical protein
MLDGSREVTLEHPREPLSWAVGRADARGVFAADAARARVPGKKAEVSSPTLEVPPSATEVRVHTDLGETLVATLEAAR